MAILSKIRERSMFLILVIGLALFAFVLDPSTISDFFNSNKVNEIGEVNGEVISRQDFAEALEAYKKQTGNRVSEMQAAKTVWNNLVRQKLYKAQLEEAGITVGESDILNALIESSGVQNQERFQTEGIFDKTKFKEFLATTRASGSQEWEAWQNYMASLQNNIEKSTYDNLVGAGLGASLKEGEMQYLSEGTKASGKFVYAPYTAIADSLVTVSKSEIKKYIENHAAAYEVDASRDIKFVKFPILPTVEDEEAIKREVAGFVPDAKGFTGLKKATDYELLAEDVKSDVVMNSNYRFKVGVPQVIAEDLFKGEVGDVFGPYKDNNQFKVSKITEITTIPDSVKASHVLIPFVGSRSATPETTDSDILAKKKADSLMGVIKKSPSAIIAIAKAYSADQSNADKGGELGWFTYNRMVPEFRDYCFTSKKGDVGVVKTAFGYHVILIEDQKNFQPVVKLATVGRDIVASEATENQIFQNAETFALELSNGKKYEDLVKESNLNSLPAVGLKALDDNVPGIGNERDIIVWAFDKEVNVGDFKRFDIDGGYAVAVVTDKTAKGLMPVDKAITKVRPILLNEKKAAIIKDKMAGATLKEIAANVNDRERNFTDVNLQSPTISGVGYEPKVVGAMLTAEENKVFSKVVGDRGVYAFVVEKKVLPAALPNYDTYRKRIANDRKNKSFQMYEAVKEASKIEDRVSSFYGIEE
ncbi:peptidylprolyl isomerase [Tenacibaculum sp. SG-28]|uniref:peptidylprolyl isomerase n=1 Tax=Tenacibaculum sp. SG-28 TaxID=754426 RepID=UPI000CF42834|nr:peptidylprolyl isomerase [Tenacibaculum sp. SG-28]PQJ22940.1 peptidylprolyl isomerase [Tenacibaculum sp. SG-28]